MQADETEPVHDIDPGCWCSPDFDGEIWFHHRSCEIDTIVEAEAIKEAVSANIQAAEVLRDAEEARRLRLAVACAGFISAALWVLLLWLW